MASANVQGAWLILTNSSGRKLHILHPRDYSKDELEWLVAKHVKGSGNDVVSKETNVPKDPRTGRLDSLYRVVGQELERDPGLDPPAFYHFELWRLEAERAARLEKVERQGSSRVDQQLEIDDIPEGQRAEKKATNE